MFLLFHSSIYAIDLMIYALCNFLCSNITQTGIKMSYGFLNR